MRYLKGTLHYKLLLQPKLVMESMKDYDVTLVTPTDATWASCPKSRKSTSGVLLEYLGTPIHFISRTQSVIAQSSAEGELYAIGSGVAEGLHVRSFLLEAGLVRNVTLEIKWTHQVQSPSRNSTELHGKLVTFSSGTRSCKISSGPEFSRAQRLMVKGIQQTCSRSSSIWRFSDVTCIASD